MNALKPVIGILVTLILILVCTSSCGFSLNQNQDVLRHQFSEIADQQVQYFQVNPRAQTVFVFGNITVEQGVIQWQLVDAKGKVQASGEVNQRKEDIRLMLEAQPGEWRFETKYDRANGKYKLGWEAR